MSTAAAPDKLVASIEDFLGGYYREEILTLADGFPRDRKSLWVEYRDIEAFDIDLADDALNHPDIVRDGFEKALANLDFVAPVDLSGANVRITDSRGNIRRKGPSELVADDIGDYVAIEGQLSKVTGLSPLFTSAAFECQQCGTMDHLPQSPTSTNEPHKCRQCEKQGPWQINYGESELTDLRKLKLEEPPEDRTQSEGESVPVYVVDDLCHYGGEHGLADHAGERVVVFGVYRGEHNFEKRNPKPEVDTWLDATAIEFVDDDYADLDVEAHREAFESFAAGEHGDPIELCKQSIAPSLEITEELDTILEASVAWLFNAYRIDPPGLDQIRGDLHMGLIGDPGTGKSSVLSNLAKIAPKCEFRSGTGLSKVGLTAAAQQEEFAGTTEWTLRPGILPRANGGHCIIDEVDDVIDEKTKAIHDALEGDQMVKVDKAGISADLPTRTAVLVSGNPTYGRYDPYEPIPEQIDLDPALISRMDILLAIQDQVEEDRDRRVASHYLDAYQELSEVEIANRNDTEAPDVETVNRPVSLEVFRTWVYYAREHCFPRLTDEARAIIEDFYIDVRSLNDNDDDPIPATPRSLGAGLRAATAYARVELSETVEPRHAERAVRISKQTIGLNYDPESGKFDANRVDTGKPRTQKQRKDALESIVTEEQEDLEGGVPIDVVLDIAEELNIDRDKAKHDINKMAQNGRFYRPHGPGGGVRCPK